MGNFIFEKQYIEGLYVIKPKLYNDNRGYFFESYNQKEFNENIDNIQFVQDNQSLSKKGTLRGLHFQAIHQQDKLVRVIKGEIFDVAVDLRLNSKTYGKYFSVFLNDYNNHQLFIPKGFAHGFLALSEQTIINYKCSDFYYPDDQNGIIWNDEDINIKWPIDNSNNIILSDKDNKLKALKKSNIYL